jgi:hypothetical protein
MVLKANMKLIGLMNTFVAESEQRSSSYLAALRFTVCRAAFEL